MRRIPLRNRVKKVIAYAQVDAADYADLIRFKWCRSNDGYAVRSVYNSDAKTISQVKMHRLLLAPMRGQDVDHINADRLDNRRCNIRVCSRSENTWNSTLNCNNTSGLKGVSWNCGAGKWIARISIQGRRMTLGSFVDKREAYGVFLAAAKRLHGPFFCRRITAHA